MTAIDQFLRAERLSPRDPKGWFIAGGLSVAYYLSGQYEASVAAARRALRENPRFAIALRMLAASYARLGRAEEGGAAVRELLAIDPRLSVSVWKSGRHAMAFSEEVQNRICEGLRMAGLPE
jgi:tetratricopeptide (TPR) repeat protein